MKSILYINKNSRVEHTDWALVAEKILERVSGKDDSTFIINDPSTWHVEKFQDLVNIYFDDHVKASEILEEYKENDLNLIHQLFSEDFSSKNQIIDEVLNLYVEVEWILEDIPFDPFDYIYDQIYSVGGLISNKILAYYLMSKGLKVWEWDAREYFKTDNLHCMSNLDLEATLNSISKDIAATDSYDVICVSNGIGATSENFTTTLGPKGILKGIESLAKALNIKEYSILNTENSLSWDSKEIL